MSLKTDYKDDVLTGERKYVMVDNGDGTVSFRDVTQYTQRGDSFGALDINSTNEAVNGIQDDIGFTGTGAEIEQAMQDELVHEGEKYYETDDYDDIPWNANQLEYDNTQSGLAATSTQGAIDEIVLGRTEIVRADGVKTWKQLLEELYTKVDNARMKDSSLLVRVVYDGNNITQHSVYRLEYVDTVNHSYSFVAFQANMNQLAGERMQVKSSGAFYWKTTVMNTSLTNSEYTSNAAYRSNGLYIKY